MSNSRKKKAPKEAPGAFDIEITEELIEEARREGWSGGELVATAIERGAKAAGVDVSSVEVSLPPDPDRVNPALRGGYVAKPDPRG